MSHILFAMTVTVTGLHHLWGSVPWRRDSAYNLDFVHCEVGVEATESFRHRAYNTRWQHSIACVKWCGNTSGCCISTAVLCLFRIQMASILHPIILTVFSLVCLFLFRPLLLVSSFFPRRPQCVPTRSEAGSGPCSERDQQWQITKTCGHRSSKRWQYDEGNVVEDLSAVSRMILKWIVTEWGRVDWMNDV